MNTFIVTNANDCPNLLSHGATFRMEVLKPNYPRENAVKGDEVPNFKIGKPAYTSNVFQILQDLRLKQHSGNFEPKTYRLSTTSMTGTTQPKSHEKASTNTNKNTIGTVNIDNIGNMSKIRLLAGPCDLPKPVLSEPCQLRQSMQIYQLLIDNQVTHKVDFHCVVCMYSKPRARCTSQEKRQP